MAMMPKTIELEISLRWKKGLTLQEIMHGAVLAALGVNDGSRRKTAECLDIPYRTLIKRLSDMRKLGIEVPEPGGSG